MVALVISNSTYEFDKSKLLIHQYGTFKVFSELKKQTYQEHNFESNREIIWTLGRIPMRSFIDNIPDDETGFVSYNFENTSVIAQADRLGTKPLFYIHRSGFFALSDSIAALLQYVVKSQINSEWVAAGLCGISAQDDATFYKQIYKIPSGFQLKFQNEKLSLSALTNGFSTVKTSAVEFKAALHQAILSRMGLFNGTELSGGIDSSAIAGILAHYVKEGHKKIPAFTHVLDDDLQEQFFPYIDERQYSELLPKMHPNIQHEWVSAKGHGLIDETGQILTALGTPYLNTMILYSDLLMTQAANLNVDTLFSGFGGDEAVSYKSNIFSHQLLKNGQLKEWIKVNQSSLLSKSVLADLYRIFKKKNNTIPQWGKDKWQNHLISERLLLETSIQNQYLKKHEQDRSNYSDFIRYNVLRQVVRQRVEDHSMLAKTKGIEMSFPLLDRKLISIYLGLKPHEQNKMPLMRTAFREAIRGLVPEQITNRNDKLSATIPNAFYRMEQDYFKVMDLLQSYKQGRASEFVDISKAIAMWPLVLEKNRNKAFKERLDIKHLLFAVQLILFLDEAFDYTQLPDLTFKHR